MQSQNREITVEIYSNENLKEYNQFILNNPSSNIYHTIEWKNIIERNFNYKSFYLLARNEEDKICAVLPLFLIKNFYGIRLDSLPYTPYGGTTGDQRYIEILIKKAIELKKQLNCTSLAIKDNTLQFDNIFNHFNMTKSVNWDRQLIKIEDPESMWNNLKKSNKENIRKAIKNNFNIISVTKEEELKEFYYLISLTYRRLGFMVPTYKFFLDIYNTMHSKGYIEVLLVRYNGEPIASSLNYLFNKNLFVAYGGWDKKEKNLKANNYLDWTSLCYCYKKSYKYLDFGLTTKENKGLFTYKSSFNTIDYPYACYIYPKNAEYFNNQTRLIKLSRILVKRIPNFIYTKSGNFIIKNFT